MNNIQTSHTPAPGLGKIPPPFILEETARWKGQKQIWPTRTLHYAARRKSGRQTSVESSITDLAALQTRPITPYDPRLPQIRIHLPRAPVWWRWKGLWVEALKTGQLSFHEHTASAYCQMLLLTVCVLEIGVFLSPLTNRGFGFPMIRKHAENVCRMRRRPNAWGWRATFIHTCNSNYFSFTTV